MKLGSGFGRGGGQRAALGLAGIWEERASLAQLSRAGFVLHHLGQACRNMIIAPLTSLLTILTISLALSFLACFVLFLENARHWIVSRQTRLTLNVFVREGRPESEISQLATELSGQPEVERVEVRSKTDALVELKEALGVDAPMLQGLEQNNPLPRSLIVRLRAGGHSSFESLAERVAAKPAVETVQYDRGLLSQLGQMMAGFRRGGMLAALVVLVMSSFIIGSTIRLAMYSHREETEIMRLVGAAEGFVRVPYLIQGCVQGALGGAASVGIAYLVGLGLARLVQGSAVLQLVLSDVRPLSAAAISLIILSGILVGLGGSYAAVRRSKAE